MKRENWVKAAGAALSATVVVVGVVIAVAGGEEATSGARDMPVNTAEVERGPLSAMVSLNGTLAYRAQPDGAPYSVLNQASGIYTELPGTGDRVGCGDVLYRVDDDPVLLLCGLVPAYRDLGLGDLGRDVGQLNRNLHRLGYDRRAGVEISPRGSEFTWETQEALAKLQGERGQDGTGDLAIDDAVFLPGSVRIAKVMGELGGASQPGAPVAQASSDTLEVRANLDASQQGEVKQGDPARVTLPGNRSVKGKVVRLSRVATSSEQSDDPGTATISVYIGLKDPRQAGGLDAAPVQADITTTGVKRAMSVPVTALVGKSGGGFAVEAVSEDGGRELVAVDLGLFDTAAGRVAVEGDLAEGDQVVVPAL